MRTALIIIDMQMMMQDRMDAGRDFVNPEAPGNIAALAAHFRATGQPVVHVRHSDDTAGSPLHPDASGYQPMPCAVAQDGEPVFIKTTSSAFASTDLEAWLRSEGIIDVLVTGAVASFCVNSAVRAGADLGFNMSIVEDAVIDFDLPHAGLGAQQIFDVSMGLLEADFAKVVTTSEALGGAG
ncbi:isochorismatase family protein [Octadecabacter sp.]|nr:isochorismatase family protein [Octadecabacter sp.]